MSAAVAVARPGALGGIRVVGLIVGIVAAALGIGGTIVTIIGPSVELLPETSFDGTRLISLPLPLRIVHAAFILLALLTVAAMALLLADLAGRVRREVRFVPAVSRTAAALAIVLGVGSWLAQSAASIARWSGVRYDEGVDPATADMSTLPIDWVVTAQTLAPNWTLLGLAIVLGVLASIIRAGERLQRDTEGLV
ncbi:hypothetical protein [Microbacterium sp.]|uniref:hypothetical protein n=1 Tax=Microbacterium sp. TaxID=51671 RepID=UPI0039E5D61A